ncbi:MAG: hypothetical protein DRR19_09160 [Candidatus Parabeggiatoa sp. nov. 1]|nr:MAG: hypothetical protein DRR19_09160 [Gammaproteobacteria bacterium]
MQINVQAIVDALREECGKPASPIYSFHVYAEMLQCSLRNGIMPKSVLEIGPGASLGSLLCFAAMGCERVAGVELSKIEKPSTEFISLLCDYLAAVSGFRWWRSYAADSQESTVNYPNLWDNVVFQQIANKVDCRDGTPIHEMPFQDNAFNFAYSIAVLEHLSNPEKSISKLFSVLQPGGITVHEIDLRDHDLDDIGRSRNHPLAFLNISKSDYDQGPVEQYSKDKSLSNRLESAWGNLGVWCNRLRRSDWEALFDSAGFTDVSTEVICQVDRDLVNRDAMVEPFQSKEIDDLTAVVIRLTARKAAPTM